MTLYRQLILFILLLFLLLFTGSWLAKLESTRSFLFNQLQSHAQDTATSLGLSLSQCMADNDMVAVESRLNAIFDRGYYRLIRLTDVSGAVLKELTLKVKIEDVPQWFVRLFPLETPYARANVMSGWYQSGTLIVESHPGYAYKMLWETATRMTIWFAGAGLVVLIAGSLGLRILLRPLQEVERQAEALCNKEYRIQEHLPRTRELRQLVAAMNRMTIKVKEMFEEQVAIAERLRQHAYSDSLTGLSNRRYLASQVAAHFERNENAIQGALLLVQVHELKKLNQQKGLQAGDLLIKRVAEILQAQGSRISGVEVARLTGGDFCIFMPGASPDDAEQAAAAIVNRMTLLAVEQLTLSDNIGHVGAAVYECATNLGTLLSEADLALRTAQRNGPNTWQVATVTRDCENKYQGEQAWRAALERAIRERNIFLFAQPSVACTDRDRIVHLEIFSRVVQEDGALLNAGLFMPYAERLDLVAALDLVVLEKVKEFDKADLGTDRIAINISPSSLLDDSFSQRTESILRSLPDKAPRITFEVVEFSAINHLDRVKEFRAMVARYGHTIGLDHFGRSFSNFGYLQSLRPDFVKIDRAYISELKGRESDSGFFISSLCSVAHSLDIAVVAIGVEEERQWQILQELNLDAMQGYFIEKPYPIKLRTTGNDPPTDDRDSERVFKGRKR
ncbi:MAG: EAL domain-containing protein [Desulfobacterales bacterium]|nr:EAL domain-containing protein [Desulfobacterales bacterium]